MTEPKIVLRNMSREEEQRAIEDLTEIGYKREAIRVERIQEVPAND